MIVGLIEVQICLVRQVDDLLRISSGFISVTGIREHSRLYITVQKTFRRGKYSLHLIIDNSVIRKLALRIRKLQMPSLLHENLLFSADIGI